jgi:hypothetical protein
MVSLGGLRRIDDIQQLVLKMVVFVRWQLVTAVALLQVARRCFKAVLVAG